MTDEEKKIWNENGVYCPRWGECKEREGEKGMMSLEMEGCKCVSFSTKGEMTHVPNHKCVIRDNQAG